MSHLLSHTFFCNVIYSNEGEQSAKSSKMIFCNKDFSLSGAANQGQV